MMPESLKTALVDAVNAAFPLIQVVLPAAFAGVVFSMNVAVLLTWVDRRQGSMIQDRIGPDRAVLWLPRPVAQGALVAPALLVAVGMLGVAFAGMDSEGERDFSSAGLYAHLGVFAFWLTALIIAGSVRRRGAVSPVDPLFASVGDPRHFFYAGLAVHVALMLLRGLVSGTPAADGLAQVLYFVGPLVFAGSVAGGALYAASLLKGDRVGFRAIGLFHAAADGLKTIFKEDIIPPGTDRLMHSIAPFISFFPALVVLAVVPFTDTMCFGTTAEGGIDVSKLADSVPRDGVCAEAAFQMQVVDLNVGILYFFALAGTGIVGAALAGYASNNKFSLLGGLRAASQMVSYEVTLGLTLIGAIMIYGTLQVDDMVRWQVENSWGIFVQPIAFVLFFAAAVAESKRIPFDLPEGESELVAGYFTEYAGMKFAMFFFGEYIAVVTASAVMAAVFLGGWHLPFVYRDGITVELGETIIYQQALSHGLVILIGFIGFIAKVLLLCWLQLVIRWTLPRFRYDQLMRLGWRMLLPASLINILATGLVVLLLGSGGVAVQSGLKFLGDLTEAVVAVAGLVALVAFIRFVLKPAEHRRAVTSSSAKYAEAAGGTGGGAPIGA